MAGDSLKWSIVCFSSVDWDTYWQRPQHVMSELARNDCQVLFVDNIGTRLPRFRDASRLVGRVKRFLGAMKRTRGSTPQRVHLTNGLVFPHQHVKWIRRVEARRLMKRVRARLPPGRPLIVWTYVPMPVVRDVSDGLEADLLVFDWVDEFSQRVLTRSSKHKQRLAGWEDAMAESADVVFLASKALADRRRPDSTDTWVIPHGTAAVPPASSPLEELDGLPHPRIGFVGSISEWVDHDLVLDLAHRRPEWSFVLVGPDLVGIGALKRLPNVTHLGERPHAEISGFIHSFDVGLIPYRLGAGTWAASPVKLREYLAHGLPVVSSDIPELDHFGDGVFVGHGTDGFLHAIEKALAVEAPTPCDVPTWEKRVETMARHIDEALAR